jgi:hypothetical protein
MQLFAGSERHYCLKCHTWEIPKTVDDTNETTATIAVYLCNGI